MRSPGNNNNMDNNNNNNNFHGENKNISNRLVNIDCIVVFGLVC